MSKKIARLFGQFQPYNYELKLRLDKNKLSFAGNVVISGVKVGRPSQRLTLHQKGLKILKATLTKHDKNGDNNMAIDRINTQKSYDEIRLHCKQMLYPGKYTIQLEFAGKITQQMHGIYPSSFNHEGSAKLLLATQFESHHAREAFPCIDEPEAKAVFQLTLVTPLIDTVLSNTPVESQKRTKDELVTRFETTPKMSTYLLAFVTGEMHAVEKRTKDGVLVRSWSTVAQPKTHLEYSADEAVEILEFFTEYFGMAFPLKKCDQVALPDFDSAAMENWGLITYREIALLIDPSNRSISNEQFVSLVIAHELSHQWFGNLVTMKWWDDLWLNESFAGFMEHVAPDAIHPDWQQWELYAASDIVATTSRDIYSHIQPVGLKVIDPDLIGTLFDPGIVYAKGARLLKMLREYIGGEAFIKGLRTYFKTHAYASATREDLWNALSEASGQNISKLMTPWLTQPGLPVLHVSQRGKSLRVSQERFMLDAKPDNSLWPVPLLANVISRPDLFSSKTADISLGTDDCLVVNQYASGHYLVDYTESKHRDYLAKKLEKGELSTEARINLLNDLYLLARHGDISLIAALDVIIKCAPEPRDSVWVMMMRALGAAGQLTEGDDASEQKLKLLKVKLARHWYKKLGWHDSANDDPNTKQLRHSVIALMVAGEEQTAIQIALKQYSQAQSLQAIAAELRNTILAATVRFGNKVAVDRLLTEYKTASPDVQLDITGALASTKDGKLAKNILDKALGKSGFVRPQDVMSWVALFLRNYHTRPAAWNFTLKNWDWLETTLSTSKSFDYLPTYTAAVITTDDWAKKYHDLFMPKQHIKMLTRNIQLGFADIEARVAWRKRDQQAIAMWLQKFA